MYKKWLLSLVVFMWVALLMAKLPLSLLKNSKKTGKVFFPKKFIVISTQGIFSFKEEHGDIKLLGFLELRGIQNGIVDQPGIFVYRNNELFKVNFNIELEKKIQLKNRISAMAVDSRGVYISSGGKFLTLSKDLTLLGELPLKCGDFLKDSHDILVYQKTAYLLDNVIFPIFTFRVDISDINQPVIKNQIAISDFNPHLKFQWLNPYLRQWGILLEYATRGVSGQMVYLYPQDSGEEPLSQKEVYERAHFKKEEKGVKILAVTQLPPIVGVGIKGKKPVFFFLRSEGNSVKLQEYSLPQEKPFLASEVKITRWLRSYYFLYSTRMDKVGYLSFFNHKVTYLKTYDLSPFKVGGIVNIFVLE